MHSNEIMTWLAESVSTRSFRPDPVDDASIRNAIAVAQRAPSTCNHQPYCVISINDEAARSRLTEVMVVQNFILEAPVWLMVCVDWSRQQIIAESVGVVNQMPQLARQVVGVVDATMFAHHLVLALNALGLGTCYIASPYTALKQVADILEAPPHDCMPLHLICAGVPAEKPAPRPRYPIGLVFHSEKYRAPDADAVNEYLDDGDQALREAGYFVTAQTGVSNWRNHYRVKYGDIASVRTWQPLVRDLPLFFHTGRS